MSSGFESALYVGRVIHTRLRPVRHRLGYKVFSMLIDVDELGALDRGLSLFSRNRFNLFSFHDRDVAAGGGDAAGETRAAMAAAGVDAGGPLKLLCYPRILGYVFNPLAVWYAHDRAGRLSAILYEVRNTFGGKHSYLIPVGTEQGGSIIRQSADKAFHVSPFMEMETRYHFRLTRPGESLAVAIRQTGAEGAILNAAFAGTRRALDDRALAAIFLAYPLMTLKVIAAIHWEALKLMARGLRLRPGAPDPAEPVTVVRAAMEKARRAA